jgi:hypothetical protein
LENLEQFSMEKITNDVSLESYPQDSLRASLMDQITQLHIAIESPAAEVNQHRLKHVFPTAIDRGLEEGFKRALDQTGCEEIPVYKKQKKESWAFHEPAKVANPLLSTSKSSTSNAISPSNALAGLTGDNRRAKISQMLREATVLGNAVGNIDPEPQSHPNGRRRFQRRNSFVIHRNRNSTGMFPAVAPSATKITHPFNGVRNEENAVLGLPPRESNVFFRRRSLSGSHSLNESNHSTRNSSP